MHFDMHAEFDGGQTTASEMDWTEADVRRVRMETQEALATASVAAKAGELPEMRPLPVGGCALGHLRSLLRTPNRRNLGTRSSSSIPMLVTRRRDRRRARLHHTRSPGPTRLPGGAEGQGRRCILQPYRTGWPNKGAATNPVDSSRGNGKKRWTPLSPTSTPRSGRGAGEPKSPEPKTNRIDTQPRRPDISKIGQNPDTTEIRSSKLIGEPAAANKSIVGVVKFEFRLEAVATKSSRIAGIWRPEHHRVKDRILRHDLCFAVDYIP